jgi:hypothetical protein
LCENNDLIERLLKCEDELEDCRNELDIWIDSLRELSKIQDAFGVKENNLYKKTILDIGTDWVKPLYIALKLEPDRIIGINEGISSIASDIKLTSRLLTKTKIGFYDCSFFDEETFQKIREKEGIGRFDFILLSKTLHHLRTGECIADKRNEKHKKKGKCPEDEKCCIYKFNPEEIFKDLLRYGKRVIVYEYYEPTVEDDDKVRGRGGYFTRNEWNEIFEYLRGKYIVEFITPQKFQLDKKKPNEIDLILKQVDTICFYVEEKV